MTLRGYDSVAEIYDARPLPDDRLFDILASRCGPERLDDVLDVGTGTGHVLEALSRFRPRRLYGVDISLRMLRLARRRCLDLGLQTTLGQATAENLPFPDASFDAVVAGSAYWWFERDEFWREACRVLRPEGRIVLLATSLIVGLRELFQDIPGPESENQELLILRQDAPAQVELLHFEMIEGEAIFASPRLLIDAARAMVPEESPLRPRNFEFDSARHSWPLAIPSRSAIAIFGRPGAQQRSST